MQPSRKALYSQFKALHRSKLHEQIVAQIQDVIGKGKLKPGDRLPAERELAKLFNVSRHCVREAIRILEQQGIVRSQIGSGTVVIQEDEPTIIDVLSSAIHRKKSKLAEIFVFRRLIEPQIASLSALNAAQSDIEELEAVLGRQKHPRTTPRDLGLVDQEFHTILARATGNSILLQVIQLLSKLLCASRDQYLQNSKRRQLSIQGHAQILNAIKARKPDQARKAMERHLRIVEQSVMDHYKRPE
jgi:GntR family transcriptional regulator, transcriptional repressor for pyruvate dehydrogenase complex